MTTLFSHTALGLAAALVVAGPAVAQPPPPGYRVYTWGYYDRFPYPPPAGSAVIYTDGPPVVAYVDPWGRVMDMPLRPKILYGNTPILSPRGYYYPSSITVMPDPYRPRSAVVPGRTIQPPAAPYKVERTAPLETLIPKARDFDAPVDPAPPPAPATGLPSVPKLPPLPKAPAIPGIPSLGPAPGDSSAPAPKAK